MNRKVLITGANRGIGLALAEQFLRGGFEVVATAREPKAADALKKLASEHEGKCTVKRLDVANDDSVLSLAEDLESTGSLEVLLNNAGIMGEGHVSFAECDLAKVMDTFNVNTLGNMRMTKAFLPLLKKAEQPVIAHITSKMGSIADNTGGGYYGYRLSKTALNMFNRSFARDFKQITSVVLHPGWVQTDMGGEQAPTTTEESAQGLYKVITSLAPKDSGKFYDFKGNEIPW